MSRRSSRVTETELASAMAENSSLRLKRAPKSPRGIRGRAEGQKQPQPKPSVDGKRQSKYRNRKTEAFGALFDSKREADRFGELKLLERAGTVREIDCQREYELAVDRIVICKYRADFVYYEKLGDSDAWQIVVEDCKGFRTRVYRIKKKLMSAIFGIEIRES